MSNTSASLAGAGEPKPESLAAVAFLRKFETDGPWTLTAIRPDRKAIDTRTFGPVARGVHRD